jgi:hypothetical protein
MGQLGDGSTFSRSDPQPALGLQHVKIIGAGYGTHALAIASSN